MIACYVHCVNVQNELLSLFIPPGGNLLSRIAQNRRAGGVFSEEEIKSLLRHVCLVSLCNYCSVCSCHYMSTHCRVFSTSIPWVSSTWTSNLTTFSSHS